MHLYWRVIEELRYLGEVVHIHDPSLLREYRRWLRKQSGSIDMLSGSCPSAKPLHLGAMTLLCGLN